MRTKRWCLARIPWCLALMTLVGCAARSPEPPRGDAVDEGVLFDVIDRDRNGTVSEEEFVGVFEDRTAAQREFQTLDTNRDQALSRDEFGRVRLFLLRW